MFSFKCVTRVNFFPRTELNVIVHEKLLLEDFLVAGKLNWSLNPCK